MFQAPSEAVLAEKPTQSSELSAPSNGPAWEAPLQTSLQNMASRLRATLKPWQVPNRRFSPETYGAKADGQTINTAAIQRAIDACSAAGGGVVLFSRGDYVTGTIELKSGVMLEVAADARILGSTDLADYPDRIPKRRTVMDTFMEIQKSLIFAEGVERVGLRGPGTIDFRGSKKNFPGQNVRSKTPGRPFGIRVIDSKNITVDNITLKDSAAWMQDYLNCEDLIFTGMKVDNHTNRNNDGIDIDGCRRVWVRDCFINSEDDAFCLKGLSLRPTEDILVENSTFFSDTNGFKIGTDTQADFRRIYARNLKLGGIPEELSSPNRQASTGVTLTTVDGGTVEDILIQNVTIERARAPIFFRVGERSRLMPGMDNVPAGPMRRIIIEDVSGAGNFRQGSLITGLGEPQHFIEDVVIRRMNLSMEGGGDASLITRPFTDQPDLYPSASNFSREGLPAYGFTVRTARRVHFYDINIVPVAPDARPEFAAIGSNEDVTVDGKPLTSVTYSAKTSDE